jgi:hypothetical protein
VRFRRDRDDRWLRIRVDREDSRIILPYKDRPALVLRAGPVAVNGSKDDGAMWVVDKGICRVFFGIPSSDVPRRLDQVSWVGRSVPAIMLCPGGV